MSIYVRRKNLTFVVPRQKISNTAKKLFQSVFQSILFHEAEGLYNKEKTASRPNALIRQWYQSSKLILLFIVYFYRFFIYRGSDTEVLIYSCGIHLPFEVIVLNKSDFKKK